MKAHVANPLFNHKHEIELKMEKEIPGFSSKYSMVTFREDLRYSEAISQGRKQDKLLMELVAGLDNPDVTDVRQLYEALQKKQ